MNKIFNYKNQKPIRQKLRKSMPKGEIVLWNRLKNNKIGYKFRRQQGINNYVVDIYCSKLKLGIEVDGKTHDYPDQIPYDSKRQKYLESLGINIKHFDSDDIFNDLDYVLEQIKCLCEKLDKEKKNY